jgi:uncharacterized protein
MLLCDVNVLVYAFRADAPRHAEYRDWIMQRLASSEEFGISELVLSGVLRILTHPRVFNPPTPIDAALEYLEALLGQPSVIVLRPSDRHWQIYTDLVRRSGARGNLAADAYHAALAIENGCTWVSADRDFGRFPALKWRHPLD